MRVPFVVLALAGFLGCASAPSPAPAPTAGLRSERLPAPDTTAEAQTYLSGAVAALRANQPRHATAFIDAILRSDHLTERGRANLYWLSAEAHRLADDDNGLIEALGGFLVAAAVIEQDEEMRLREVEARAAIVARKVKGDSALGKTRSEPIAVEDARDPSGIVAELGCVEEKVSSHGESLQERRLICTGAREPLVLWFDLTHSHAP